MWPQGLAASPKRAQTWRKGGDPFRSTRFRFQNPPASRGVTDPEQQGRGLFGPIVVDEAKPPDVDLDVILVLSEWNVDASGRINDDFADPVSSPGKGLKDGMVFANGASAPLRLKAPPGARARLCLGNAAIAADEDRGRRRKNSHRRRRRPAERAVRGIADSSGHLPGLSATNATWAVRPGSIRIVSRQ